jgi:hypothetical protein
MTAISKFIFKPWAMPLAVVLEVLVIMGGFWALSAFLMPSGYIQVKPEQKPKIEEFSAGDIRVIDLRSGTEFNRILIFPNGRTVVEAGYVNSWGEQRIRIIGERIDP